MRAQVLAEMREAKATAVASVHPTVKSLPDAKRKKILVTGGAGLVVSGRRAPTAASGARRRRRVKAWR